MSIFGKLGGTIIRTALLPVAITQDFLTLGGAVVERDEPYTASALKGLGKNVKSIIKELEDD